MKTPLHLGIGEARSLRTLPLAVLAWLESTALKIELAPFLKRARASDSWYLCRGEETFGPVPFEKILRMLLRGEGPLPVLHQSEVTVEPAPWHALAYRPWPLNKFAAGVWIGGFWLATVALGFVVVSLLCPVSIRTFVGAAYLIAVAAFGVWLFLGAHRGADTVENQTEDFAEPETVAEPCGVSDDESA